MKKKKNRALSLVLALTFMFTLVLGNGMTVFAENGGESGHAHPCGAECTFVEGVVCNHDCTEAPCGEDDACGHDCADETCSFVQAVDCDHDEATCEDCPAPVTGSITGFEMVELAVEVGTAEEDIAFPSEVTATVQPEGEDAEAATITVAVSNWRISFGDYNPDLAGYYFFVADVDALPEGVTVGLDGFGESLVPSAQVTVGDVEVPEQES